VRFTRGPILVAEDDPATLEGLTEFLSEFGYAVVPARNGQQAMDRLLQGVTPSLVILDISMPEVGGEELSKYMQADPELRLVPVVVVTGSPDRIGRTASAAVLEKPLNLISLLALVKRLTSSRGSPEPAPHPSPKK
jgi:two-component system, cell cycle response regulator DivK